jgi:hypothetical protein
MDIVKITLTGYGCEFARGTIKKHNYKKIESLIDDVWHKNLFKKIKKETEIKTYSEEYGIIKGDLSIELNGEHLLEYQLTTLEVLNFIEIEEREEDYPKTEDIVLTTVQHQEGLITEVIFVTKDDFDVTRLRLIKKNINYNSDKNLKSTLYCGLYYEDEKIPLIESDTDLRSSFLYLEKNKNKN